MTLHEQIKNDLKSAMKAKDELRKDTLRVILGEFSRSEMKELPDEEVVRILRKLIKSERELLEKKGDENDSVYITIIESYLPVMVSEDEIVSWINENIDFSAFRNKMQAMRPIMEHFGPKAEGNLVKEILQKMS